MFYKFGFRKLAMAIQFFFQDVRIQVPERNRLKSFIESLFKKRSKRLKDLNYIFCSDEYLLGINNQFLDHDEYTDIISFNLSEDPQTIEGEIYISTDRIRDNAQMNGVTVKSELHRVIFHGTLHLCGYKDKKQADKIIMTQEEDKCLSLYLSNVPRGKS